MKLFNRSKTNRVPSLTVPSSRTLRIEFLEERALLSVGDAVIYGPVPWVEPADRPEFVSASELARSERTPLMMDDAAIYGPIPWVEPADRPELMSASELTLALKTPELLAPPSLDAVIDEETDSFLDELETSVSYSESDEVEALKPAFFVDGDAYYSLSEVMTKRVVFENQAASTPSSDDVILVSEQSSSERNDDSNGLRSGGEGGESWFYELSCDSTYIDSGLSFLYQNPLLEGHGFDSGQSFPTYTSTYLTIMASAVPTSHYATIRFSGSATAGVDYDVYFKYDNFWSYYSLGDISYSGGPTTFYIVPKNDNLFESVETVVASLFELEPNPTSGGGAVNPVSFTYGTTSITASIIDDDQWEVEIEATDQVALEPSFETLSDFSDEDRSASITVSRVPTAIAQIWSALSSLFALDLSYGLSILLNTSGAQTSGTNVASDQDFELRTTLTGSTCGTTITIPADSTQQTVYVRAQTDSVYENDEIVTVALGGAWSGTQQNSFECSDETASITIYQAPEFISGNDIAPLEVVAPDSYQIFLDVNAVYTAPILGDVVAGVIPLSRTIRYAFYSEIMGYSTYSSSNSPLLSIAAETGIITVLRSFTDDEIDNPPTFTVRAYDLDNSKLHDSTTLEVKPLVVDLDIDNLNMWRGTNGQPDRSSEEEELENNEYATGKIIKPNWDDVNHDGVLDCWDGFSNGGANQSAVGHSAAFYPIIVQIPDDVPLSSITVSFDYAMASPVATNGLDSPPAFGDGTIRIWTKDGYSARNANSLLAGGDYVMPSASYTPAQLGMSDSDRDVVLFVEGVSENRQKTRALAVQEGLPETTIKLTVTIDQDYELTDEVRYVVSDEGSFYYELMMHPELISAYASQAIYDRSNKQEYSLRLQTATELSNYGVQDTCVSYLTANNLSSGLSAGLYREYVTGKFIITFAGTQDTTDWYTNFCQAFNLSGSLQYSEAITIGNCFSGNNSHFNSSNTYITGHSLGGGLASAASIVSGFHAYTFNAAGLHHDTVDNHPNLANANQLIDSYRVDYDILSWGQWISSWLYYMFDIIPSAIGTPITIDSEYDYEMFTSGFQVIQGMISQNDSRSAIAAANIFRYGVLCHSTDQVIYGMEKRIF